ncbi:putative cyclin-box carrying protein [Blattamonas nauphoetae]|uniref:Cyclin-box carrying protein n=1 Tax=Blattamonas nauphoetae TaxID=2049346 RepID=A0ABQ9Y9M4_9EUKA|nr:putative cyclin-box carrying protein [Blattamonas nauphoetae]
MATQPLPSRSTGDRETPDATPPAKGKYPFASKKVGQKRISASTSTPIVSHDIRMDKPHLLLEPVCLIIHQYIEQGEANPRPILPNMFSEKFNPLHLPNDPKPREFKIPGVEEIRYFATLIVQTLELNPCAYLMALCYIERIIKNNKLTLHSTNWRRVLFSCLLLSGKVFHDEAPWNADMSDSFQWITLDDVNRTEMALLSMLDYSVRFSQQLYTHYYLQCREISQRVNMELPSEPLTQSELDALVRRSNNEEERIKSKQKTAMSMQEGPQKVKLAVIN